MSSYYDTMQVCKNWGHKITNFFDTNSNHRQERCDKCGSETTSTCEFCNTRIRGFYHIDGLIDLTGQDLESPLFCYKCGKPYPWKNKLLIIKIFKTIISPAKYLVDSLVSIFKKQ